jgi:hypothetical protein
MSSPEALYVRGRGIRLEEFRLLGKLPMISIAERLEGLAIEGDSPVGEIDQPSWIGTQVPRDTRNPVGIWEDHLPRLNTT